MHAGASWEEGGCATGFPVVPFRGAWPNCSSDLKDIVYIATIISD